MKKTDPYTEHAIEVFGVHEEEVTEAMREWAKRDYIVKSYDASRKLKSQHMNQYIEVLIRDKHKTMIGLLLYSLGVLFAFIETWYFGNNWFPASPAEWLCDGIAFAMAITGSILLFFIPATKVYKNKKDEQQQ